MDHKPLGVRVEIRNNAGIQCLLAGSAAIFTCNLEGFPRPSVQFFFDSSAIVPADQSRVSNISFDQVTFFCVLQKVKSFYLFFEEETSILGNCLIALVG